MKLSVSSFTGMVLVIAAGGLVACSSTTPSNPPPASDAAVTPDANNTTTDSGPSSDSEASTVGDSSSAGDTSTTSGNDGAPSSDAASTSDSAAPSTDGATVVSEGGDAAACTQVNPATYIYMCDGHQCDNHPGVACGYTPTNGGQGYTCGCENPTWADPWGCLPPDAGVGKACATPDAAAE